MSETTATIAFEIRATQLPSTPRTYSFKVFLEDVEVSEGYEFSWNFGDGGSSELPNPAYTYPNPGSFEVSVDVQEIDPRPDPEGENKKSEQAPPIILVVV
ncbi:MAG: PKD domain-containing protein [Bacteroidota bacterium]